MSLEFIFTLALALRCYPLQPGGLLAIEAVSTGDDVAANGVSRGRSQFPGHPAADVHGGRHLLHEGTAAVCVHQDPAERAFESTAVAAVLGSRGVLSAFLDALTVTAVIISVAVGFFGVYHKVASGKKLTTITIDYDDDRLSNCTATTSRISVRFCAA